MKYDPVYDGTESNLGARIIITVIYLELLVLGYAGFETCLGSIPGAAIWSVLITVLWWLLIGAPLPDTDNSDVGQSPDDFAASDKRMVCVTSAAKGVVTIINTEALIVIGVLWHNGLLGTLSALALSVFAVGMWVVIIKTPDYTTVNGLDAQQD